MCFLFVRDTEYSSMLAYERVINQTQFQSFHQDSQKQSEAPLGKKTPFPAHFSLLKLLFFSLFS